MEKTSRKQESIFRGILDRLNEPGAARYSAFVQLRTFGRASTSAEGAIPKSRGEGEKARSLDGHSAADMDTYIRPAV